MTSYSGLLQRLSEKGLTKSALTSKLGISSKTIAKIGRGERIADHVMQKMADFLNCPVSELCQTVSDNALLQRLRDEKKAGLSGGIYHELQVRMTYNSNHIEGSRLSEDQTRMIFETNTLDAPEGVSVDDIIETTNHFRAIDYCIDKAEESLSEEHIKQLHRLLKQGTKDATLDWFSVGDWKKIPNTVGGKETISPKEVPAHIKLLLSEYEALVDITVNDIIGFHYKFETIHPFQDGNGRVGRLIAFKECLRHNIVPFIIEDSKKMFYYRGLAEWEQEKGYLTDTCLDGQDTFKKMMRMFHIPMPE